MNGKCDREVGSVEYGWHNCNGRAVVESKRRAGHLGSFYSLEYCERHRKYAGIKDSKNEVVILEVCEL